MLGPVKRIFLEAVDEELGNSRREGKENLSEGGVEKRPWDGQGQIKANTSRMRLCLLLGDIVFFSSQKTHKKKLLMIFVTFSM